MSKLDSFGDLFPMLLQSVSSKPTFECLWQLKTQVLSYITCLMENVAEASHFPLTEKYHPEF